MRKLIINFGIYFFKISALAFVVISPSLAANSANKADNTKLSANVISKEEYDLLRLSAEQARAALISIQPVKASITKKIEKLKLDYSNFPSESKQSVIDIYESRLEKTETQERQVKQTLLSIEKKLADLKNDPEQSDLLNLYEADANTKAATEKQKELLRKLQGISPKP